MLLLYDFYHCFSTYFFCVLLCLEWFAQSFKEVNRNYYLVSVSSLWANHNFALSLFLTGSSPAEFCHTIVFSYFTAEILGKNNRLSSLVVGEICSEFHREGTSTSVALASSGLSVLWNFHEVAQKVALMFLAQFVLYATFLLNYVSKFAGL